MPEKNSNKEEYISLTEATKYCDYTQEYLSLRARQGKLKAKKFARNWVTTKEWVEEYFGATNSVKARTQDKQANRFAFLTDSRRLPRRVATLLAMTRAGFLSRTKNMPELRYAIASVLVFAFLGAGLAWGAPTISIAKDLFNEGLASFSEEINQGAERFSKDADEFGDAVTNRAGETADKVFAVKGEIATAGDEIAASLRAVALAPRNDKNLGFAPRNDIADIKYGLGYTHRMVSEYTQWLNQTLVEQPIYIVKRNAALTTTIVKENVSATTAGFSNYTESLLASVANSGSSFYNKYVSANDWVENKIQKVVAIPEKLSNIFSGVINLADKGEEQPEQPEPEQEQEPEIQEAAKEFAETGDIEKLQQKVKDLEARGYQQKEIIKEVKQITRIQPVQKITKQTNIIDSQALITLATLEDRIVDIEKWEQDIRTLKNITKKLQANPPTTSASTAPIYIGSQGIQVGGAGIFSSLGVSGSAGLSNLSVGGSTSLGSTTNDKLTVNASSEFIGPITITGAIAQTGAYTHTGAFTQSGDQVTLGGNVDTTAGLDVTGGDFTIGGTNFVVNATSGDLVMIGNLSLADITASGDVVISGGLTVAGAQTYSGSSNFTASSTSPVLTANQTGSGGIVSFQKSGTNLFEITNSGAVNILASAASIWKTTFGALTILSADTFTATSTGNMILSAGGTERMRILASNGYVGIATSTPSADFAVQGNIMGSGNIVLYGTATSTITGGVNIDANTLFVDPYEDRVGINTATPGYSLHVAGQCVTGDTRLTRRRKKKKGEKLKKGETEDEQYIYDQVMIKNIQPGDEIASMDPITGKIIFSQVQGLMDMGERVVHKLVTQSGREIKTTENHPYFVRTRYEEATAQPNQKFVKFEVDQSIRIEQYTKDTIIAIANKENSFAVVVPRKVKQILRDDLRQHNPKKFTPIMFASGIVSAIEQSKLIVHELAIDIEYPGHEDIITKIISKAFPRIEIDFIQVGKKSPAHFVAYGVYKKQKIADYTATIDDIAFKTENALRTVTPPHIRRTIRSPRASLITASIDDNKNLVKGKTKDALQAILYKDKSLAHPDLTRASLIKSIYSSEKLVKSGQWTKVKGLKVGQMIAVTYGDKVVWEKIVEIKQLPAERVYDIEVKGTHNFVANGIIAHNTYISTDLSVAGTATTTGTGMTFDAAGNITAGAESLWQTTSGALNITAAAESIWKTSTGGLTIQSAGTFTATSTGDMIFGVNDVERIKILASNGYVGIATSTPSAQFAVTGDVMVDGDLIFVGDETIQGSGTLVINPTGNLTLQTSTYVDDTGNIILAGGQRVETEKLQFDGNITINASSSVATTVTITNEDGRDVANLLVEGDIQIDGGKLTLATGETIDAETSDHIIITAGGTQVMDIIAGGVDITGQATTSDTFYVTSGGASITGTITATGNIVPGDDSTHSLGASGNEWLNLYVDNLYSSTSTHTGAMTIDGSADAIQLLVQGHSTQTSDLAVFEQHDGTDLFVIDGAGNTAFGIAAATSTITGGVNIDANTLFVDPYSNRVGIGTASPEYDLHVAGIGQFDTSVGVEGTATTTGTSLAFDAAGNITAGAESLWQTTSGALNITAASASTWQVTTGQLNITTAGGSGDIVLTSAGDTLFDSTATFTSTSTDASFTLGDGAGTNKFYIRNSTSSPLLTLDSVGNLDIAGNLDMDGSLYQPVYGSDDGLVLDIDFSEGMGTKAYDKSRFGNDGTLTNFNSAATSNGSTTALIDTALTDTADIYVGAELYITGGSNIGEHQTVSAYNGTDTLTVDTAFSNATAQNDTYIVGWGPGKYGNGLMFDGGNDYVRVANFPVSNDTFSYSFWFNKNGYSSSDGLIDMADYEVGGFCLFLQTTNTFLGRWSYSGGTVQGTVLDTIQDNQWYFVTATYYYDSGSSLYYMDFYLDGDYTNRISSANQMVVPTCALNIGKRNNDYFNGSIDGVKIYNRALHADEVKAHYLRGTETHADVAISDSTSVGNLYGNRIILTDTGAVTSATDYSYGEHITVNRTGTAAGGTVMSYGVHSTVTGDTGGTSTTTAGYFSASGADSVYGVYSTITAASGVTGYGLYVDAGTGAGTEYSAAFINGNVGIGSTTPSAKLTIDGDGDINQLLVQGNDPQTSDLAVFEQHDGTDLFVIDGAGNTAFGIAAATSTITGGVNIDSNTLFVDPYSNRVGIGTASPEYDLHVAGQCVTGDTLLPIVRETYSVPIPVSFENQYIEYIRIDEIKGGEMVLSLNEKTGLIEPARIKGLMDMGVKQTFKMTTEDGRFIRTTGNHPYLTKNGWRKVTKLKEGDEIAVPREMDLLGVASVSSVANIFGLQDSVDKNSSSHSQKRANEIKEFHNKDFNIENSNYFSTFLSNDKLQIQKSIANQLPQSNALGFETGEAINGTTIEAKKICPIFANIPESAFNWTEDGFITSNDNSLDASVKSDSESDIVWQKIESIEPVGKEQVWDIEVRGTHNFVAGHFIPSCHSEPAGEESCVHSSIEESFTLPVGSAQEDNEGNQLVFGGIIAHNTYILTDLSVAGTATTTGSALTFDATGTLSSANAGMNITGATASTWKTTSGALTITAEASTLYATGTDLQLIATTGALTASSTGALNLISSTGSIFATSSAHIHFALGDAAGANNFYIRDSTGVAQLTVDSNGNVDVVGTIDNGLIAWWPLDEGAGLTAADKSKNSKDGTITGHICDSGYALVPGNSTYGTSDFCVMKYEAKKCTGDGNATSTDCSGGAESKTDDGSGDPGDLDFAASYPEYKPWHSIQQDSNSAQEACTQSGGHLITNNEWMTIARNAEQVDSNWTSGVVGTGALATGWVTSNTMATSSASYCEFNTAADTCGSTGTVAQRRTLTLSNGEVIWDLSGNVWEWINHTGADGDACGQICQNNQPESSGAGDDAAATGAWFEFDTIDNYQGLSYDDIRPSNSSWISTYGMGKIWSYGDGETVATNRAFLRGGRWNDGALAGAFTLALSLGYSPTSSSTLIGFRCVR